MNRDERSSRRRERGWGGGIMVFYNCPPRARANKIRVTSKESARSTTWPSPLRACDLDRRPLASLPARRPRANSRRSIRELAERAATASSASFFERKKKEEISSQISFVLPREREKAFFGQRRLLMVTQISPAPCPQ